MLYSELVEIYEALEATTKKLEKRDILAALYKKTPVEQLYSVVLLSMGIVTTQAELGIAREMAKAIIAKSYGVSKNEIVKKFRYTGDLGLTAEYFCQRRKQITLVEKKLNVNDVYENLSRLPNISGVGSVEKKINCVSQLLANASPKEARYIIRTVLGEMRVGVAAGLVRDAIAKAFNKEAQYVEKIYNFVGDYGRVAELVKKGKKAEIEVGIPIRVMLAERAPNLKEALEKFQNPALEYKYDGFRMAIHKKNDKIWLFSRRLENVTSQFPEIVKAAKENLKAKSCIVEGEVLAIDKKGNPRPFQELSRRIQRKYNIEKMTKEIPVKINLFDIVYVDGKNMMQKKLKERWNFLRKIVKEKKPVFCFADHLETKNLKEAQAFYEKSLAAGQEGLIVKNLDAIYQPGKRVGYWLKVKPIMEPLDLVILGAKWGEGARAKWLGSLVVACREKGKFLPTGMIGSGLTEEQLEETTKRLKKIIIEEKGREVKVKPEVVVEVAYEEIQKSPKYPTGFALRFPRLLRFREKEKRPEDANTKEDIKKLFEQQKRK